MLDVEPWQALAAPEGAMRLSWRRADGAGRDWAVWWPGRCRAACALYLHGHGSGGDQPFVREDVARLWVPELRRLGLGIVSPHLGSTHWMGPRAAVELRRLLAAARREFGIERFYVVSGSMGGSAALVYAALHPEDVAAVAALCPATDVGGYHDWCRSKPGDVRDEIRRAIADAYGGTPETIPDVYAAHSAVGHADRLTMPVLVIHGTRDALIPVRESRRLAAAMRGREGFTYVEIQGGDHEAPLSHEAIWPWLAGNVAL